MMKTYKAFNIDYETDGENVDLPEELFFEIDDEDFDPAYELADLISDRTGWLVNGFSFEEVKP